MSDINLGLSQYHNRFDIVQARCITGGVSVQHMTLVWLLIVAPPDVQL